MLGFYGAKDGTPPELPAKAVKILKSLAGKRPEYLKPGRTLEMPGLPEGSVRVHVLGPPRKDDLLYRKDPRKGESYDHALVSAALQAAKFLEAANGTSGSASREEEHYPFNQVYKRRGSGGSPALKEIMRRYHAPKEKWRTVDDDWIQQAEALSLYLDTFTNNSSLVLAIELVASGKVLLFAADAPGKEILHPVAVVIFGGLLSSTLLDTLLTPLVFERVGRKPVERLMALDADTY